jgi:hypothetical protein
MPEPAAGQQTRDGQRPHRLVDLGDVRGDELLEQARVGADRDAAGHAQQPRAGAVQAGDHRVGVVLAGRRLGAGGTVGKGLPVVLQQTAEQQRVAAAEVVPGRAEAFGVVRADGVGGQRAYPVGGEHRQHDPGAVRRSPQRLQLERGLVGAVVLALREQRQHRRETHPPGQIGQADDRRAVGPVDLVNRDDQRITLRQLDQDGAERVHDLRVDLLLSGVGADTLVQQVHRALPLLGDQRRVQQQLAYDAERQVALGVRADRGDGQGVPVHRPFGVGVQQFGLPGCHRTGDDGDPSLAGHRRGEQAVERGDSLVPLHQSHDRPPRYVPARSRAIGQYR